MEPRDLPSIAALAGETSAATGVPEQLATMVARRVVTLSRERLEKGAALDPAAEAITAAQQIASGRPIRVVNATGVLLHTNLGRAPLHETAARRAAEVAAAYGNVELDLATGARGKRAGYARELLLALTGAEDAYVVNNNAGALLLALAAVAAPGTAVVSRGEEIEIGGSFRLPELMAASGARLVEVGTTNRTRLTDYTAAMPAAAILKVHPSNYRLDGFVESVGYQELGIAARDAGVPLVADIGSGLLDTRVPWLAGPPPAWLSGEPGVRQTLEAGADVVLFSGDKLLGGPQAGIAVGRADLIGALRAHPVARAVRIDGPTHAALTATLELYASNRGSEVPLWAMVGLSYEELEDRHRALLDRSRRRGEVIAGESVPGAGSVPGATIPSPNLKLSAPADRLWAGLLAARPPILARRREGSVIIDLRTVAPADDDHIAATLAEQV
jgi:L-seryl-tRNA(Ser) seleniumtransferase